MNKPKNPLIFVLFLALISCTRSNETSTTAPSSDPLEYSMDHLAEFLLENPGMNAVSIGIYQEGKARKGYYGEVDPGKGNAPTNTSERLINRAANFLYDDLENFPKKNPYFELRKAMLKNTKTGIADYHKLKAQEPETYTFDDPYTLNRIGYDLLQKDRAPEAIHVFKLMVDEFPELANAYDSLGEGYFLNKQYDLSLKNYQKSLALNPENGNAVAMMGKIAEIRE